MKYKELTKEFNVKLDKLELYYKKLIKINTNTNSNANTNTNTNVNNVNAMKNKYTTPNKIIPDGILNTTEKSEDGNDFFSAKSHVDSILSNKSIKQDRNEKQDKSSSSNKSEMNNTVKSNINFPIGELKKYENMINFKSIIPEEFNCRIKFPNEPSNKDFYYGCVTCKKSLKNKKCPKCNMSISKLFYKIKLNLYDSENEISAIMFDRVAEVFLDMQADKYEKYLRINDGIDKIKSKMNECEKTNFRVKVEVTYNFEYKTQFKIDSIKKMNSSFD